MLAIGSFTAGATPEKWKPLVPAEMRETALLYLSGKIDQWYVKPDQSGVVFMLNVTEPADAKALLDPLPAGPRRVDDVPVHPARSAQPDANDAQYTAQVTASHKSFFMRAE